MSIKTYRAKINDVENKSISIAYLTTGIKKDKQSIYDNSPQYSGGNGSYVKNSDREYHGSVLNLVLFVHERKVTIRIDIREYVLELNKMKKVSSKLFDYIVEMNCGKNINVYKSGNDWYLADYSQIYVVRPKKKDTK